MKLILTIAGLGGFLYGVDFGVIAAAEPYMKAARRAVLVYHRRLAVRVIRAEDDDRRVGGDVPCGHPDRLPVA